MISYDPNGYANRDLRDDRFYADVLASMGQASNGSVAVTPYAGQSIFPAQGGTDMALDLQALLPVNFGSVTADNTRRLYHGSLYLGMYASFNSAFSQSCFLVLPFRALVLTTNVDIRAWAVAPTTFAMSYFFPSVMFTHLRLSASVDPANQGQVHWSFNGMKVTY